MRAAHLPSLEAIAAAGRLADVLAAAELHERALPPARRDLVLPERLRIVYLVTLLGASAFALLVGQAEQLAALGADVTVLSRGEPADPGLDPPACHPGRGTRWQRVPYGVAMTESVPPCDLIVAGSWELVLPARMLGVAPVVLVELGGLHLLGDVPAHVRAVVASSLRAAAVTFAVGDERLFREADVPVATDLAAFGPREVLHRYQEVVASAPVESPYRGFDVTIGGLRFARSGDTARLRERLGACTTRQAALPVSQPAFGPYRAVRWRVVARRASGEEGTTRMYLPARSERPLHDAPAQAALDLLVEHKTEQALARFAEGYASGSPAEQAVLGRWVVLAMIGAGRPDDAFEAAAALAREFPVHPDFVLLAGVAAREARRPVDLGAALERVQLAGVGARYDEWFENPYGFLAAHLGVGVSAGIGA